MRDLIEKKLSPALLFVLILIVFAGAVLLLSLFNLEEKVVSSSPQLLVGEVLKESQSPELATPEWSRPVYLLKKVSWEGSSESICALPGEAFSGEDERANLAKMKLNEVKKACQKASRLVVRRQIELRAARIRKERLRKSRLAITWRKVNGDEVVAGWSNIPRPYLLVNFPVRVPAVALTFDDGPHPRYTKQILNILKKEKVHATFFVVGMNARYYPSILRRIVKQGNELGNHTYSHLNSAKAGRKLLRREIKATDRLIKKVSGHSGKWFRPPGALIDGEALAVAKSLNYQVVLWNVDSLDWQKPKPKKLAKRVLSRVKPGSIVLFHDSGGDRGRTVAALPLIIKGLKKRRLAIVTISELVKMVQQKQAKNF